ncbi:pumilio homolog 3 [Trichogramma pretiosum]|uniref:pumilio homolog 3 n=1 Tax=Trichogramma pretiosum TaxID=7493 RepID=UPI0006C98EEF|nr:pumilio homolog 3 [Trichogramma pretiosum]
MALGKRKSTTPQNKNNNKKARGPSNVNTDKKKIQKRKPTQKKPNVDDKKLIKKENSESTTPVKKSFDKKKIQNKGPRKPNLDKAKMIKKEKETAENEKPNWLEYKKEQKELREKRRAKKLDDAYDIVIQAKKIGEKIRRAELPKDEQAKLTKQLHDLLKTHYLKMIFMHDLSRVIQWQIKYSNPDIQLEIVTEIRPQLIKMFFCKYSKNIIKTLLKTAGSSKIKQEILEVCYGNVVKLTSSVLSASMFEKIYVEIASVQQKLAFKQEFYGDYYKKSKDKNIKSVTDVFEQSPDMKSATLTAMKANLNKILNKNLINSSLVHTVLYEFLSHCSKEDKDEIMALARPLIAELSQTKDGAKAANICIWNGTNKDKKVMMKTLKEHVKSIATSDHGSLMLMCLFDAVDDTVLLKKIIIQEIINNIDEIAADDCGRRVIMYMVAKRDSKFFHPTTIDYLKQGDNNEFTKKPQEVKAKEILESVSENLLESISEKPLMWLNNGKIQIVTLAILNNCSGPKLKEAFASVAKFITDIDSVMDNKDKKDEKIKAIEEAGLHMTLKKIIQMDQSRKEKQETTFGEVLLEYLTEEVLENWVKFNRGCFLLVNFIKCESEECVKTLKEKLKNVKNLKAESSKGAEILLENLN